MFKKKDNTGQIQRREPAIVYGEFPVQHLQEFRKVNSLSDELIIKYRNIRNLPQDEVCKLLDKDIDDRMYYMIKEGGLAVAALFEGLAWEIVALASHEKNYMKATIDLDHNLDLWPVLTSVEKGALRHLANTIKATLRAYV